MTAHIDTLKEWWENAEEGVINEGDRLIFRDGEDYDFRTAAREDAGTGAEKGHGHGWAILARAPIPKPAWHDAVAVIAHTARFSERRPFALTHTADVLDPYNTEWITRDDLIDPVPLIEAKVTDEMVDRVREYKDFTGRLYFASREGARHLLAIALGLEAE